MKRLTKVSHAWVHPERCAPPAYGLAGPMHRSTHPPKRRRVPLPLFTRLGVFTPLREENGGCGAKSGQRGGGGGAHWSWRVDSICIWHTDCTKYANGQTMTFAVLFFLPYCSLCLKSTGRARVFACVFACVRVAHLSGASISSAQPHGPHPCSTNHMKGLPPLRIALSKATLMFGNGDGCL